MIYGKIYNFKICEDVVIYEVYVCDFILDFVIVKDLIKLFGIFEVFIEKLDYFKDLGVIYI